MRIGPKPKGMCSTPLGQAKFALRTYVMHQYYGISPTCWWSFDGGREKLGTIEWGFVCAGARRPGWYAIRNLNAVLDLGWMADGEMPLGFEPADGRFYSYRFRRGDERLVAFWAAVSMRDANTGKAADVFVPGAFGAVPSVECIDLLSGDVQRLAVEPAEGGVRLRGMIVRDYPLCLRYSHDFKHTSSLE